MYVGSRYVYHILIIGFKFSRSATGEKPLVKIKQQSTPSCSSLPHLLPLPSLLPLLAVFLSSTSTSTTSNRPLPAAACVLEDLVQLPGIFSLRLINQIIAL